MHFTKTIHYYRSSSHWFQMPSCFSERAVRVNKPFVNFINAFFLTGNKIQEIDIFNSNFLEFALMGYKIIHIFNILVSINCNYSITFVRFLNGDFLCPGNLLLWVRKEDSAISSVFVLIKSKSSAERNWSLWIPL